MTTVVEFNFKNEVWHLEKCIFIVDRIGKEMENYYTINKKVPEKVCVRIDKNYYTTLALYHENIWGVPIEYSRDWSLTNKMVITIY